MTAKREVRLFEHGFVRLDDAMASDLSVVNSARVSFAKRKEVMDESDAGLVRFLMRDRHGTPFEHNAFRFHVRCPLFVAREWFRHRIGCLTGDVEVTFVDKNGRATPKLPKTIDELWRMWSTGERNGHRVSPDETAKVDSLVAELGSIPSVAAQTGIGRQAITTHAARGTTAYRDARWRLRRMRLRVLNEETREFEVGHLCEVIDKGVQPVYRITLADGKQVTATENHRLLTDKGWMTLRSAVGLVGTGETAIATRACRLLVNASLGAYRDFARGDVEPPSRRGCRLAAHPVRVVSVEYVGLRQTYDLCVEGPWHNFLANGIVVHNSFNEESARYHQLEGDFYVPDPVDVRSQVGRPGAYTFEPVDPEIAERVRADLSAHYEQAYRLYEDLIERGLAKELSRCVLPMGTFTQFYWTVNARSLMNFISLRAADTAQLEIRRYADALETFFAELMPITYEAFVANGRVAP